MSSVMRCRNGLMGVSLIGGSPVLRLEVRNPSILKTERPAPSSSALQLVTAPSTPRSHLRAALSRESGFVHWPDPEDLAGATGPSGLGDSIDTPIAYSGAPRKDYGAYKIEDHYCSHTQDRSYDDEERAKRDVSDRLLHDKAKEAIHRQEVYRDLNHLEGVGRAGNGEVWIYAHNEERDVECEVRGPEPTNSIGTGSH